MKIIRPTRLLALVLSFVFASVAIADDVNLYVAPTGRDTNPGTKQQPLATITGARDAVRRKRDSKADQNIAVIVQGGTYHITEPIVFGPNDGGAGDVVVTYRAADGERPMISGGRPITGWRDRSDGTWSAEVPEARAGRWRFRELFINGQRRPRARHPNKGYLRVVQSGADRRTSFTFKPGDIPRSLRDPNLELLFLHDWSTSRVRVKSIDHGANVLTVADPIGCKASHYRIDHFEKHPRYRLENDPVLLDAPGEWYLNTDTGVLFYRPLKDESISKFNASPPIAPVATALLQVRGDAKRPVRNLRFDGLHFAHCAWSTPSHGFAAGQATFHERRDGTNGGALREPMPTAVTFERAEQCRFVNGSIMHTGGSAIWLGSRCDDWVFAGNIVSDIAGNGILIGEDRGRRIDGRYWWQAAPQQVAKRNIVKNNLIEHCGQLFYGAVGVWVGMAEQTTIANNEIRHLPYTGVSVGWMWNSTPTPCKGNRVERNHIHHVMQILSDGGGIYTLGRQPGTVLSGNVIHDVPTNLGRAESNGMFLDQGTSEMVIENNLIYAVSRSPLRFHQALENLVRNNILVTGQGTPIVRYNATEPRRITLTDNEVIEAKHWTADFKSAHERAKSLISAAGRTSR